MDETQIAQLRKTNPAELIQKALGATAELAEHLENIETSSNEIKAALRELYRQTSEIKTKVDFLQECVQRHQPISLGSTSK